MTAGLAAVPAAAKAAATWSAARRVAEADRCADIIACGADTLQGRPARPGLTAGQVHDAIVAGLGILACRPGGAGFAGMHWHAGSAPCVACPGPGSEPLFPLPDPGPAVGAVFTPRQMAEDVVANTLAALIVPQPVFAASGPEAFGPITQRISLSPVDDIEGLRVADPFCGTGAFLVAAARYLGDALAAAWDDRDQAEIRNLCALYGTTDPVMAARALVITRCLHGADRDPGSVELAGLALQLLAPDCQTDHLLDVDDGDYIVHVACAADTTELRRHARLIRPDGPPSARLPGLRAGDSLTGRPCPGAVRYPDAAALDWPDVFADVFDSKGGFDVIISNPPFLGGLKIPAACGRGYREHLVTAITDGRRATVDLAVYCWLRMHQLAHRGGVVGIVGPDNMLVGWDPQSPARTGELSGNPRVAFDVLRDHNWQPYRACRNLPWPARSAAVRVCTIWTHQWNGADPPGQIRNIPEQPPDPRLWHVIREVEIPAEPGNPDAGSACFNVYAPRQDPAPARPGSRRRRPTQAAGKAGR